MQFDVITIFPEVLRAYFNSSILARAQKKGIIKINVINLRDFAIDKKKIALRQAQGNRELRLTIDDKPYGGGPGMVFKIEPLVSALDSILKKHKLQNTNYKQSTKPKTQKSKTAIILLSASGEQFNSKMAVSFAKKCNHIILIAGHYEGIDGRIKSVIHDSGFMLQEISIGPYVLTGGEAPAMVLVDAVARHVPGVLGKAESLEEKRYGVGIPAYTRPEVFVYKGKRHKVPKVLLSGDHKKIEEWRRGHEKMK